MRWFTIMIVLGLHVTLMADFYVIPVSKKIKNVVTVAKSGAQFDDIQKAIDSIKDANSSNKYTVFVAPETFVITQSITLKPYVSLIGAGLVETVIHASGVDAVINSADYSNIFNFKIDINGTRTSCIGISNKNVSWVNVSQALIIASCDGISNYGIYDYNTSHVYIDNVAAAVAKGVNAYGIYNEHSDVDIRKSTAQAFSATDYNVGINYNSCNGGSLTDSTASGEGGTQAIGVNFYSSRLTQISGIEAKGESGSLNNIGVDVYQSTLPVIKKSTLEGADNAINGGSVQLSIINGGGTMASCTSCIDELDNPVGADCN